MSVQNKTDQLRWINEMIDYCISSKTVKPQQTKDGKRYNLYPVKKVIPEEARFFFGQVAGAVTVDTFIVVLSPKYTTRGWKQYIEHVDIVINDINNQ